MALRDNWQDLVSGVSEIDVEPINEIAQAVIEIEENATGGGDAGGSITVDDEMSATSTNPVQNKVVKAYVDDQIGDIDNALDRIIDIQNSLIGGDS